jgi:hypothetical protein
MNARDEFPELKRLDVAFRDLREATPAMPLLGSDAAFRQAYAAWTARRDSLVAELAAVMAEVNAYLCGRCSGTGLTVHGHRHGGMCYRCQGDGWSARGRRRAVSTRPAQPSRHPSR